MTRHGPMVHRVCRNTLLGTRTMRRTPSRRPSSSWSSSAASIRKLDSVASWLYGVAAPSRGPGTGGRGPPPQGGGSRNPTRRRIGRLDRGRGRAGRRGRGPDHPGGGPPPPREVSVRRRALLLGGPDPGAGGPPARMPDRDGPQPHGTCSRPAAPAARPPRSRAGVRRPSHSCSTRRPRPRRWHRLRSLRV